MADGKRRRVRPSRVASGADALIEEAGTSDLRFVTQRLQGNPKLAAVVASLIRDGALAAAVARKEQAAALALLGPKLPAKAAKLKSLPGRFVRSLVREWLGAAGRELVDARETALDVADYRRMMYYAVGEADGEMELPRKHAYSAYENPMKAVLTHHEKKCGKRLSQLTVIDGYGYYELTTTGARKGQVRVRGTDMWVKLPMADSLLEGCDQSAIQQNHSLADAFVWGGAAGWSQKLFPLLEAQHPNHGKGPQESLECPEAADDFKGADLGDGAAAGGDFVTPTKRPAGGQATPSKPAGEKPALGHVEPPEDDPDE